MQTRTLGDLRAELASRLNMAGQAVSEPAAKLLNSFLREAHDMLCQSHEWPAMRRDWLFPCVVGQTLYPLPADSCGYTIDPLRIQSVTVQYHTAWLGLEQGIDPWRYTISHSLIPTRYDLGHGNVNSGELP